MLRAKRQAIPLGRYAYIFSTEDDHNVLLVYHAKSGLTVTEFPFSGDCRTTEFDAFMLTLALNTYFASSDATALTEDVRRLNAYLEFRAHFPGTFVLAPQNAERSARCIYSDVSNECFLVLPSNSSSQCDSSDFAAIACVAMNRLIELVEKALA